MVYGLKTPESFVDFQVESKRENLSDDMFEAQHYSMKAKPFMDQSYLQAVDMTSTFYTMMKSLDDNATYNMRIMNSAQSGANQCFNRPNECV